MTVRYTNQYSLRILLATLILAACCTNQATGLYSISGKSTFLDSGQTTYAALLGASAESTKKTSEHRPEESKSLSDFTKDYIKGWPDRVREDTKACFLKRNNIIALSLACGASIALHSSGADDQVARNFRKHQVFNHFADESLHVIGSPWAHFGASALWFAVSAKKQDQLNRERAWTMMRALSMTTASTLVLKAIRSNKTPNDKRWSWPSGHTSSSFAVASVLHEFYGPKVGFPAYALAGLIGCKMMDTGDHWASDVAFGATLGCVVGHSIAARDKKLEIAGFKVMPYMGNAHTSAVGISLVKEF